MNQNPVFPFFQKSSKLLETQLSLCFPPATLLTVYNLWVASGSRLILSQFVKEEAVWKEEWIIMAIEPQATPTPASKLQGRRNES